MTTVQCKEIVFVRGIAVDERERGGAAVYITGDHKLQMYSLPESPLPSVLENAFQKELGDVRDAEKNSFHDPNGVCVHGGKVYVCDSGNHCVQVFTQDLSVEETEVVGITESGESHLKHPEDLDFNYKGDMYVVDSCNINAVIVVFAVASGYETVLRRIWLADSPGAMKWPVSLRIIADTAGMSCICVSDYLGHCITFYSMGEELLRKVGISRGGGEGGCVKMLVKGDHKSISYSPPDPTAKRPTRALGLAVDSDGYIYVASCHCNEILLFD